MYFCMKRLGTCQKKKKKNLGGIYKEVPTLLAINILSFYGQQMLFLNYSCYQVPEAKEIIPAR